MFLIDFNDFMNSSGHFGIDLGSFGVTLGSFLVYGGTLEPYLREFGVDKLEMASVIGIYAGLVGPKSGNVEKVLVFKAFLKGSRRARVIQENEQQSEPG